MGRVGKYPISNVRNTKAAAFHPPTSGRFPVEFKHSMTMPHHSTYNPSDTESNDPCKYILSKHKTLQAKRIVAMTPHQKMMSETLGPGALIPRTSK